jgi:Flp pilus assembly protein TadD
MARYANGISEAVAGDFRTARSELSAAVDLAPSFAGPVRADPRNGELRYLFATALGRQKKFEEAEAEFREVIRLRPAFAGGYEGLGVILKWRGDLAGALPLFRKAAALDPNYSAAWCDLAGALATLGETKEALDTLGNYRSRHPEDRVAANLEVAIRGDAANPR